MKVMPLSRAALSARLPSSSLTSPQEPPICQAPKPISEIVAPVRPKILVFIECILSILMPELSSVSSA